MSARVIVYETDRTRNGIPTANVTDERHDSNRYRKSALSIDISNNRFSSISLNDMPCSISKRESILRNNKPRKKEENDARNDDCNRSTCSNIDINESHATLLSRGLRSRTSLKFPPTSIPSFLRSVVSYSPNGKAGGTRILLYTRYEIYQISCAKIETSTTYITQK